MTMCKRFFAETKILFRSMPIILPTLFVVAVIAMNLLANKSISLPVDWLALDCGILLSWVAFLAMDIVTKRYGVKAANTLTVLALLINLLMAGLFAAAAAIPGEWSQSYVEGSEDILNTALNNTFLSSWYVIAGSSVAFLVSGVLNNVLNHAIGRLFPRNNFAAFSARSYVSTVVAQFVDNLLFAFLVSYHFFGWSALQCVTCAATGAVVELLLEVVFSPLGYRVVRRLERDGVGQAYLDCLQKKEEADESSC